MSAYEKGEHTTSLGEVLFYSNEKEGNIEITRFANACAHFSQIRVNSWAKGMSSVTTEAFLWFGGQQWPMILVYPLDEIQEWYAFILIQFYLYSFSRSWLWGKERNAALGNNKWYFLASALPVWFSLIFSNLKVPDLWKKFAPEMVHLMPSYNSISSMSFCVKYVIYKVPLLRIDRRLFLANVNCALPRMFPQL